MNLEHIRRPAVGVSDNTINGAGEPKASRPPAPLARIVVIDLLILVALVAAFALYHFVLPQPYEVAAQSAPTA